METIKIIGTDFIRDVNTKVLINTNEKELEDYLDKVASLKKQKTEIDDLKGEIQTLKTDVCDIKDMLTLLSHKLCS
jgi:polyhydroxyalkanoate synthesis regulator phasin